MTAYGERIPIKTRRELQAMREASRHVAEILLELRERVKPGVTTAELDRFAEKAIAERGRRPRRSRATIRTGCPAIRRCCASR